MKPNDFTHARFRLVALYLLIIASVIALFSYLVIRQADDAADSASTDHALVLTTVEATARAEALMPGLVVTDTEYEIENGDLYFTIEFEGERDVKANLFTGAVTAEPDTQGMLEMLTDDFDEMVVWIGVAVFLLAALLSHVVAGRTLAPIAENIRKQRQFVSGAAHELRNPLAALHARLEAALRSHEHEKSRGVLEDLLEETQRLIALSEELLLIERDEERVRSILPCSVTKQLSMVRSRLMPLIEEKKLSLHEDIADEVLRVDAHDLETVLYNLVHNAVKFSHPLGSIRISWKGGVLSVADDGPGIPAAHLPHLFERFYKADVALTGTGLGLALVHDVVKRYGGTVRVESVVGRGTTFIVSFR